MHWPSRRMLVPTFIGVSLAFTIAADVTVALRGSLTGGGARRDVQRLVAATEPASLTTVAPLHGTITPNLLVAAPQTLPPDALAKIGALKGVKAVEPVDAARALVAGRRVSVLGVDPSTFRAYTPSASASSDALWRNIAGGDVAVSFTMGHDDDIPLASWTQVGGATRQTPVRVGAYATMGIGDIDAVVSHDTARVVGLPTGNAMIVSAPRANLDKLRKQVTRLLPKGVKTAALQSTVTTPGGAPSAGRVMSVQQVDTVIKAAESKLGMPYVWGGESDQEGGYDCSGLVQYAFAQAGIKMPRTADIQAFTGWRIPYGQAQPGDLLTWKNDPTFNGVSHIAIYLGNNKMVVAPHTGTVVQIQTPYMTNFWGAIRVNPRLAAGKAGGL